MNNFLINLMALFILGTIGANADCYTQDKMKTYSLFEKAFKKIKQPIKTLYWMGKQTNMQNSGYSLMMTFDGKSKRGLIQYDKQCTPKIIKISAGYGEVKMYYYNVKGNDIKLLRTRKNTYHR